MMTVEVVYALPDDQDLREIRVPTDATAADAIRASGLLERFSEIDLAQQPIGIFGRRCEPGQMLQPGDRVEIYRPLIADPKERRRRRAASKR